MSLTDLVPVIQKTRIERRPAEPNAAFKRWRDSHRKEWNAYRRAWYARKKA